MKKTAIAVVLASMVAAPAFAADRVQVSPGAYADAKISPQANSKHHSGFAHEHPWITTAGGLALMGATSGVPQIFGLIFTISGVSHVIEPNGGVQVAKVDEVVPESKIPLCNGEIAVPSNSGQVLTFLATTSKKERAESLATKIRTQCEESPGELAGGGKYSGQFSQKWDEKAETMQTQCAYSGATREIIISFVDGQQASYAKWRTVGANCGHLISNDDEAYQLKKNRPDILD